MCLAYELSENRPIRPRNLRAVLEAMLADSRSQNVALAVRKDVLAPIRPALTPSQYEPALALAWSCRQPAVGCLREVRLTTYGRPGKWAQPALRGDRSKPALGLRPEWGACVGGW